MANTPTQAHEKDMEQLHKEGNKALVINILFFIVLFAGMLAVPFIGLTYSAIAIGIAFVLSMLYIYLT